MACDAPPPLPERPAGSWRGYVPRWNGTLCPLTPARHFECCFLREAKEGEARVEYGRARSLQDRAGACVRRVGVASVVSPVWSQSVAQVGVGAGAESS